MNQSLLERISDKSTYGVGGFFDVETTGLSPNSEKIVELCLTLFVFVRQTGEIIGILDSYTGLNDPGMPIGKSAQKVHGITDEMVQGQQLDLERINQLMELADFFVAHNAAFDRGFLQKIISFPRSKKWHCTCYGINWTAKGYRTRKLQHLLDGHGLAGQNHRADGDVAASIQLLSQKNSDGSFYLLELLQKEPAKRSYTAAEETAAATEPPGKRPNFWRNRR
ncbi:MAG: exonuclease [Paenibacillaceae bacterium]|jgi:DNA polymerase-3 subunit epsilon|nr:exonuclease [Paenibacillaceae bacterium]